MALPAIGAVFAAMSQTAGASAGGTSGAVGVAVNLSGAISSLAKTMHSATAAVTGLAGSITDTLMGPLKAIEEFAGSIGKFVHLANPAAMTRFTLAMNDALAVMGHMLTPVMESLTVLTRAWGDSLAKLSPVLSPIFNAISDFIVGYASGLGPVLQAAAPFLQLIGDVLIRIVYGLGAAVGFIQGALAEFLNILGALFGLQSRFDPAKSSTGAARVPTSVASVEQTASKVFRDAAQNIMIRDGADKEEQQLAYLAEIAVKIKEGQQFVKEIRDFVKLIVDVFRNAGKIGGAAANVDPIKALEAGIKALGDIAGDFRRGMFK